MRKVGPKITRVISCIYTTFGSFRGYFFSKNPDFCDFGLPGTSKVLKSDRFYKGSASGAGKVIFVKFHEVFTLSQNFVQKS